MLFWVKPLHCIIDYFAQNKARKRNSALVLDCRFGVILFVESSGSTKEVDELVNQSTESLYAVFKKAIFKDAKLVKNSQDMGLQKKQRTKSRI